MLPNIANFDCVRRKIERVYVGGKKSRQIARVAPSLAEVFQIDGDDLLRRIFVVKAEKCDALADEDGCQAV